VESDALDWLDQLQGSGIRPGLGRIRALLRALGNPHRAYRSIIVAGTNGKGSTSATLTSILRASGYRVALYTSPHLVDLRERWLIDGEMIDPALLRESIEELRSAAAHTGITPTYFEALTLIAFIAFARSGCEIAVLEVGMGGRLDATNVVRPLASIITPIGFDHMEFLGNTIRKIASEKAGVIHRGAIVVTSNNDPVILGVLERRAKRFSNRFVVSTAADALPSPLRGEFQKINVGLAVQAARELAAKLPRITGRSIVDGVAATKWRGRLERHQVGDQEIWIDGGHNHHAVLAIAPFIEKELARPRLLVFGMMSDKDVSRVARELFPLFDRVIATDPYSPRSLPPAQIVALATEAGVPAIAIEDPDAAIDAALRGPERSVFIGGSLYLAGAAVAFFDRRTPFTQPEVQ
jgi:dihydrofolate synthase / folylpolyglutamate synthase